MSDPEIKYKVGDRVEVFDYPGEGYITYVDYDDPYVAYQVQFDGRDYSVWVSTEETTLVEASVTLSPEKAAEVREALEALGWDREDMGPLAGPEKRHVAADVTFPDDADFYQALEALEETARKWHGTIEF